MNDYVNVKFDSAREKIIEGANLVCKAVETTFGPNANNVCIKTPEGIKITKDGATVSRWVNDPDPYISMGIEIMKDISVKTAKDVGDASSTSVILANYLIHQFKDNTNPIELSRQLHQDCNNIINWLEKQKKEVTSKDDLLKVATLSANNDPHLGELISDAFNKVGKDGIVTFKESKDIIDRVEYNQGFRVDSGYYSPYFINTPSGTCELENVYIHISDTKMEELKPVVEIADKAMKLKKSLLLIAPGFDSEILVFLNANLNLLKSCAISTPNFRNYREIMLNDIKALIGESQICKKIIVTKDKTTFIGCESNKDIINNKIQEIRDILKNKKMVQFDLDFHAKRLANFTSGVATINVGGYSDMEIKEKMDRVEDAVRATQCAIDGGILPGGGFLFRVPKHISNNLAVVTQIPFNILCNKKQLSTTDSLWEGWDFKTMKYGNMYEMGIIEPFLVVKTALENAVNTASLILTINCAILKMNVYE